MKTLKAACCLSRILLFVLLFSFSASVRSKEPPILDLSHGRDYSEITKGGLEVSAGRKGGTDSFNYLEKLKIVLAEGAFTLNTHGGGLTTLADGQIEFLWFTIKAMSADEAKKQVKELSMALKCEDNDFDTWVDRSKPDGSSERWIRVNLDKPPMWEIEFGRTAYPSAPFIGFFRIYWDSKFASGNAVIADAVQKRTTKKTLAQRAHCVEEAFADNTGVQMVKCFLQLVENKQWSDLAKLYDANGLDQFRRTLSYFDSGSGSEWGDRIRKGCFGQQATADSVSKLTNEEFFAGYLGWTDSVSAMTAGLLGYQVTVGDAEIVGSVADGQDRLHFILRYIALPLPSGGPRRTEYLQVFSLKKQKDGNWKIAVPDMILLGAERHATTINQDLKPKTR